MRKSEGGGIGGEDRAKAVEAKAQAGEVGGKAAAAVRRRRRRVKQKGKR